MKLPHHRALALLGLLTLAGLLIPREGAAIRFLRWDRDLRQPVSLGDPEMPGGGTRDQAFYFRVPTTGDQMSRWGVVVRLPISARAPSSRIKHERTRTR